MQDRLARGPIAALGVTTTATAEDVRTAFLQLTKRYHPVRFGRMAADIQKQANEVFLALRAAHDAMTKLLRRPAHPGSTPPPSSPLPVVDGRTGQGLPSRPSRPPPEPAERTPTPPGLPAI